MQLPVSKLYDEHHFWNSWIHAISYLSPHELLMDIVKNNSFQILRWLDVSAHSNILLSEEPLFNKNSKKIESPWIDGFIFTNLKKNQHQTWLLLRTADCTPLTFASHDGNTMGIIHIWWQWLITWIVKNLWTETKKLWFSLSDINIWIWPMAGEWYEFWREDYQKKIKPFLQENSIDWDIWFCEISNDTIRFNLKTLIQKVLIGEWFNKGNIIFSTRNTLDPNENLPSWRKQNSQQRITTMIYYSPST